MKTAISIPDKLFKQADRLAKRLRISRSELYARAVEEYLQRLASENVTERLNAVYGQGGEGSDLDSQLRDYQHRRILEETEGETW